jgi:hypothetical protein
MVQVTTKQGILRENPDSVRLAVGDMHCRCQLCFERGGGHVFEFGEIGNWLSNVSNVLICRE